MNKSIFPTALLVLLVALGACSSRNQTSMMKSVTGKAGELVVVISPEAWAGEPGSAVKGLLAQAHPSLPQDEPMFDLINIPHEAFGDIFKTSRNLVIASIGSHVGESGVSFKRDVSAFTQAVFYINAKNYSEFTSLISDNSERILSFFIRAERDRLVLNYSKYHDRGVSNLVQERFGVSITVPPGFKVVENKEDFMWVRYETPEISQGLLIYSYPYAEDETFTVNYMVARRNIILRDNVPGSLPGSYMSTESQLPVVYNVFKRNGNYSAEMRGLWIVVNDFMGGPFISLSTLDLLNNRVVVIDGYVYAPSKDKRNFLRQVEAMIYSSAFVNQEDINKVNIQFEL
jgi:hypothetical protein